MKLQKKIFFIFIILTLATTLLLSSCNDEENDETEENLAWPEMPENTNPNLQYFGYYHYDMDNMDDVVSQGNNNISRVEPDKLEEIAYMYDKDYAIFIKTQSIFFQSGGIHPNWETKWEEVKTNLAPYMDKIEGFYIDEPVHNNYSIESFHLACQTARTDFPNKRMISVLAYQTLDNENADYFKYCTDLGYDLYESWNKESILEKITRLEEEVAIYNQNIWLIPKAFYTLHGINRFLENMDLEPGYDIINWIKGSYEIAVNDHRISAIYAFAYDDDAYDISLERFFNENNENYQPEIKELYLQIGKAVIANHK